MTTPRDPDTLRPVATPRDLDTLGPAPTLSGRSWSEDYLPSLEGFHMSNSRRPVSAGLSYQQPSGELMPILG